jgi:L-lactate dehydrogenase (cytochrome)
MKIKIDKFARTCNLLSKSVSGVNANTGYKCYSIIARQYSNQSRNSKSNYNYYYYALGLGISTFVYSVISPNPIHNDSKKSRRRIIVIDDDDEDDDDEIEEESEEEKEERLERERLERVKNKPPLSQIFNISDFEYVAKQILPFGTWGYYSTGSDDEFSLRENHYAFGRIFFRPKCLVDVANASIETDEIFGIKFDAPFYCTAFAGAPMAHPDAEKNLLAACGNEKIPYLVPFQLSFPFDGFMNEARPDQSNFHQVHFYTKEQLEDGPTYLKNLEKNYPNIKAVFINVDLPCLGNREKDSKIRAALDPSVNDDLSVFASSKTAYLNITWDDMDKLNKSTALPIVLKGVLRKEDVLKAAEIGLDGCLISNHGGRQLDFAMPPIEILAQSRKLLRDNGYKDKDFKLFIDGGIRRGSDIIKAICLGADAVGLGRPFLYAMASYGQPGVERAMQILKDEMMRDMKLLGVNNLKELNEDMVDIESLKYKGISSSDYLYNSNYTNMPSPPFRK